MRLIAMSVITMEAVVKKALILKNKISSVFLGSIILLFLTMQSIHAQLLNLADLPLTVTYDVKSNVLFVMDDSGSMAWGYSNQKDSQIGNIPYYSSHHNKMYYDPTVTYSPPLNSSGASEPDANYYSAVRGYYYSSGNQRTYNLSDRFFGVQEHFSGNNPVMLDSCGNTSLCGGSVFVWKPFCLIFGTCWEEIKNSAFYYVYDGSNSGCNGLSNDSDCYDRVEVNNLSASERTNFANWFQYYAIRSDATKTSMLLGLSEDNAPSTLRIGRFTINNRTVRSGLNDQLTGKLSALDDDERDNLYDWIRDVPTSGGTPLRAALTTAGDFYTEDNAYYEDTESESGAIVGCRSNATMLITDGFDFASYSPFAGLKANEDALTLPDGTYYDPNVVSPIFSNTNDTEDDSLADIAFHFWATDLHSSANIAPTKSGLSDDMFDLSGDLANWQHMRTYAIAFGAEGTLSTDDATYQDLLDGTQTWPDVNQNDPSSIDDLYHATIVSRGDFINAKTPDELRSAIQQMIGSVTSKTSPNEAVGITSSRVGDDSGIFIASFDPASWSGNLQYFTVSNGSDADDPGATGCNAEPLGTKCSDSPEWSAYSANEPTDLFTGTTDNRTIITYDRSNGGIAFRWNSLNTTQKNFLKDGDNDATGELRLEYVRGSQEQESANGGAFRTRAAYDEFSVTLLGSLVHTNATYVSGISNGTDGLQYIFPDDLEDSSYSLPSRDPLVYVGGNAGMLHALDVDTGKEEFAYVPNEVIENLHDLTDPNSSYNPYVDGLIDTQDVYIDGQWRTLLVGGLRTGGQGVYALDITSGSASENNADNLALWEFTDEDDVDMGYTFGQPVIVKSNYDGGRWVVLVPNGYNSAESDSAQGYGYASLFILDAESGDVIKEIRVGGAGSNGLSSPVAVNDNDIQHFAATSNGTDKDNWTADYVYAGDLQGNLWKFDISSTDRGDWRARKLFKAPSDQAITAKPSVGSFPVIGDDENNREHRIVYFGTGQFISQDDLTTIDTQAFYSLIDRDETTCGTSTSSSTSQGCIRDSDLVEQTLDSQNILSTNSVASDGKGCKIGLKAGNASSVPVTPSERVVNSAVVVDDIVLFPSIESGSDVCDSQVQGSLYAANRFTCGAPNRQIFQSTNGDGVIQDSGKYLSRLELEGENIQLTLTSAVSEKGVDFSALTNEDVVEFDTQVATGRVRWRQIR